MASFNIELNNKPDKGSNEHALMLRITVNRKHARLNLLYSVKPIHFNPSYNQLISFAEKDKLLFHEKDVKFLNKFEAYLLKEGKVLNTIAGYIKKYE